ncbi:hypothetical protein OAZ24_04995 [Synechococcus sp. AH-736-G21]|nr:hypothetical protein [Synechococcus sp. AH-736-G21]
MASRQRVPKALATELQWATLRNVIELVQDSLLACRQALRIGLRPMLSQQ